MPGSGMTLTSACLPSAPVTLNEATRISLGGTSVQPSGVCPGQLRQGGCGGRRHGGCGCGRDVRVSRRQGWVGRIRGQGGGGLLLRLVLVLGDAIDLDFVAVASGDEQQRATASKPAAARHVWETGCGGLSHTFQLDDFARYEIRLRTGENSSLFWQSTKAIYGKVFDSGRGHFAGWFRISSGALFWPNDSRHRNEAEQAELERRAPGPRLRTARVRQPTADTVPNLWKVREESCTHQPHQQPPGFPVQVHSCV